MSKRKLLKLKKSKCIIHKGGVGSGVEAKQRKQLEIRAKVICDEAPNGELCRQFKRKLGNEEHIEIKPLEARAALNDKRCREIPKPDFCDDLLPKVNGQLEDAKAINAVRRAQGLEFRKHFPMGPKCYSEQQLESLRVIDHDGRRLFAGQDLGGQEHVSECLPQGQIDSQFVDPTLEAQVKRLINKPNLLEGCDISGRVCSIAKGISNMDLQKSCISPAILDSKGNCKNPDIKSDISRFTTVGAKMIGIPSCLAEGHGIPPSFGEKIDCKSQASLPSLWFWLRWRW